MTQIEFVTELEQALRGNVEERIIQENVRYYNDYISAVSYTHLIMEC